MAYEGEMVRLRAIEREDVDRYVRWLNDPGVTRTLSARYPLGREGEREILERFTRSASYRDVNFAIEDSETGEHIGAIGIGGTYYESRWGTLGIFIGEKDLWGKGYGFDALRTMLRFAFWEMNLLSVRLDVLDHNERAHDLYQRIGFVDEGTKRGSMLKGSVLRDASYMSITREEFEALHGMPPDLRDVEVLPCACCWKGRRYA
jgi:RimJ/RimL family protein N-acetyltransferase